MRSSFRIALRVAPALVSVALLGFVLRSADLGRALGLVNAFGWRLPLLLLPNLLALLSEAGGWWLSLDRLGRRPRWPALLGVRISCDALMLGLPSGTVVSESFQPYLLKQRCGLALEKAIVACVARKYFVLLSHGLFLLLATLLAWPAIGRASHATIGRLGLPWLLVLASLVLLAAAQAIVAATTQGRLADRIHRVLDRLGGRWLGAWLERNAARFHTTDEGLRAFFRPGPAGFPAPLLFYLAAWLVRSLETLLFLRVLGVEIPLATAMVIESALILVRAMAVPIPAGLGVQDLGYVLCLRALHLPDAVTLGAAFVVLKRGRDLFFILLGLLLLASGRSRALLLGSPGRKMDERAA